MKPRLVKAIGWWWCYDDKLVGRGLTPRAAWDDWVDKQMFCAEMGISFR